ncbi:MAG: diguanylate cyclase with sensor [Actinomycetia bacterium]|nr:diguanylate cyclase with sensor [Actinomycetes bacterium]
MTKRPAALAVGLAGVVVPLVGVVVVLAADVSRPVVVALLLVAAVAGVAAVLLTRRNEEYVVELERGRQEFRRSLVRLGDALGASDNREELVRVTLDAALALTSADTALFWVDRGPSIDARAGSGAGGDEARRVPRGEGLVGRVADTAEAACWGSGPSPLAEAEPVAVTALAVPVRARGRLYGVLSLYRSEGAPFGDGELDDVVGLARQAGSAIDTTYLHDEARRLSLTDGLTGLWNRRQFELRVAQEVERAVRFRERFSLVMVDLDDFKAVNDTHGHLIGDAVLVETAQRLVAHTREVDTVARFGGEEFILLLPQTDAPGAVRVAEKVRDEVAAKPVITDAGALPVTLSAGVACHPDDGTSIEALLGAADEALYAAKAAGKNRVVHAAVHEPGAAPA